MQSRLSIPLIAALGLVGCGILGPEETVVTGGVYEDHVPVPLATVILLNEEDRSVAETTTDRDGRFQLGISGECADRVGVSKRSRDRLRLTNGSGGAPLPVRCGESQEIDLNFDADIWYEAIILNDRLPAEDTVVVEAGACTNLGGYFGAFGAPGPGRIHRDEVVDWIWRGETNSWYWRSTDERVWDVPAGYFVPSSPGGCSMSPGTSRVTANFGLYDSPIGDTVIVIAVSPDSM